jgi:hypothetical protein
MSYELEIEFFMHLFTNDRIRLTYTTVHAELSALRLGKLDVLFPSYSKHFIIAHSLFDTVKHSSF